MKRTARFIWVLSLLLLAFHALVSHTISAEGEGKKVYVVPVEQAVEKGLASFLERSVKEARQSNADHIIFSIDTPGGAVDAASSIAKLFQNIEIPNTAFVEKNALSAGSYIALNADQIYMTPGSTMGAAGVITGDGNAASKKAQSNWIKAMRSAAETGGRDPKYAEAMANPDIDLPKYQAGEGKYLTLSANEAVEVGYAEGVVDDRAALLKQLNLEDAVIVETSPTFSEQIARLITNPVVVPILLSIASLGFVAELYSPGFGVAGIMGLLALVLFFYGHLIAGLAGYETIIFFALGIICIVLELFVPGGILGIIGVGAVIGSLFMTGNDMGYMAMSIGIALMVAIIASVVLFKTMGLERGFLKNIILNDSTSTEKGYISSKNRLELIGLEGITLTPLRPSGTGDFDNERIDVVTEGGFIEKGKRVKVVKTEGTRVIVREINKEE
ncbi:nodulation protein NfeD [Pontibacillus yanchengensis]|uniref:Nodulation protein NfeD n=2 Tax=Pontibacillus yanchengensis TaxID=462910 RepID=A0ACC7VGZ3_9BACI|nr:nodulation protein NfeD [Pontibacillus yanchengensis]MYL33426.1 nodulation protein NfeD [Pontibacillus yanchengensis]MYL53476.1 nodulation protein NfeD [Pontibacillus yanchengensis]